MLTNEIKKILKTFNNQSRFYSIRKDNLLWIYDSYSHDIYLFDDYLIQKIIQEKMRYVNHCFEKCNLIDTSNLLFQLAKIDLCKQDSFLLPPPQKDVVYTMINTSHRCNLNCSYCYRDKTNLTVNNINNIEKAINFIMDEYRPNAIGYVFTYSMTSESSLDIDLLEQILEKYPNFEQRTFKETDIKKETAIQFYELLLHDLNLENKVFTTNYNSIISEILSILNRVLENKNLFEILNLSEDIFNEYDLPDVRNRESVSKWKLLRINSLMIEKKYGIFLNYRSIPWLTFNFFTNGTCANKRFLDLLKKINVQKMDISLDGPEEVHDFNRKFYNKTGSYSQVRKNIGIILKQGIELNCSAVITPFFPKPLEIAIHAKQLGFKSISMVPVRYGCINSFNKENIEELISGYDSLFKELEVQILDNNFELIKFLKDDLSLSAVITFLNKTKKIQRCEIDNQLVIDVDGNIYQCLYNCSEKIDCIGNIKNGVNTNIEQSTLLVSNREPCNTCWARYLCGGTCYYTSKKEKSTYSKNNTIECKLKKFLCKRALEFIIFLRENGIQAESFFDKIV